MLHIALCRAGGQHFVSHSTLAHTHTHTHTLGGSGVDGGGAGSGGGSAVPISQDVLNGPVHIAITVLAGKTTYSTQVRFTLHSSSSFTLSPLGRSHSCSSDLRERNSLQAAQLVDFFACNIISPHEFAMGESVLAADG